MNTKDIEEIFIQWLNKQKSGGVYVGDYDGVYDLECISLDGWFNLSTLVTTLTQHHQAEVERAYRQGKQHFLKDIRQIERSKVDKKVSYIMFDEVGEVDWDKVSEALTPTKTDKHDYK